MPRHRRPTAILPAWVKRETNDCLRSVAEDAYTERHLAEEYGARNVKSCAELLAAAAKSLRMLEDAKAGDRKRCAEGDRAARKYWEAKVCARRPRKRT